MPTIETPAAGRGAEPAIEVETIPSSGGLSVAWIVTPAAGRKAVFTDESDMRLFVTALELLEAMEKDEDAAAVGRGEGAERAPAACLGG